MALLLYIIEKIDIYERGNRDICLFLFKVIDSTLSAVSSSLKEPERGGTVLAWVGVYFFLPLHIELVRTKRLVLTLFVLDATRQNSWTFVCVQLFAVSWLLPV
jgi:hypothetical protein